MKAVHQSATPQQIEHANYSAFLNREYSDLEWQQFDAYIAYLREQSYNLRNAAKIRNSESIRNVFQNVALKTVQLDRFLKTNGWGK